MEIIQLSKKEIERGKIIIKILDGKLTKKQTCKILRLSLRQIYRLCKKYKDQGLIGLAHKNRGKSSNRKIGPSARLKALELINKHYSDFGPQLIKEQLEERHHIRLSREWIRSLMIEKNLWKVNKRKNLPLYRRRERRPCEGDLIQIDGSYEKWFEDRNNKCCLINMVDDATGKIQELYFTEHESTESYFEAFKRYINRHGCPLAVYTDRHMIFKSPKGNTTQFGRAMKELKIELIHANSPQAKGRVERSHGTLQDRLIKMMRLEKISSMEEGNKFLENFRIDYNKRFARKPKNTQNAHRDHSEEENLNNILCVKEQRKISKNLNIQYKNKTYQIIPKGNGRRLIGKTILLYEMDNKVALEYMSERYDYTIFEDQPYVENVMDRKKIDAFLDKNKPMPIIQKHRRKIATNF